MVSKQFRLYGRVQGVGFRYYITQKANMLGIKGFVRNEADGTVYIEATAPDQKTMQVFEGYLRQGPSLARVDKIDATDLPPQSFDNFEIR